MTGVRPEDVGDLLIPCTNLRRVGVGICDYSDMPLIEESMLRSLRSRRISVIYLEIVSPLQSLQVDDVWLDEGWRQFEDFLCQLADERIDDSEPLALELAIWRGSALKSYGPLNPGTILSRFREKGLIRFTAPPEDPGYAAVLDEYGDVPTMADFLLELTGIP